MLTPLDIQNAVFHRSFRGYNEAEVDEFLDRVVIEYEQLLRENLALKARLAGESEVATASLAGLGVCETPKTPELAETGGRSEAERLSDELERLRRAVEEESRRLETLRNQRRLFATQFQAMLESYQAMLAEEGG
ncbi:MAG: DivIVA domain-containing protein [Bacillota bacterium]|nr:DivIVA domain-containing protein [Bacillota bacterium]